MGASSNESLNLFSHKLRSERPEPKEQHRQVLYQTSSCRLISWVFSCSWWCAATLYLYLEQKDLVLGRTIRLLSGET